MKTILISTLAAAAVALSASSAFAMSNSPQGRVIVGGEAPPVASYGEVYDYQREAAPQARAHFLSGRIDESSAYESGTPSQDFGLSSNAVQGREFHAVQQGGHWYREGGE